MKKTNKLLTAILALGTIGVTPLISSCGKKVETEILESKCSVELTRASIDLNVGDTFILGANISGGTPDTTLVYKSSDESVLTINEFGFMEALKPGTVEIKAIYGTALARCKVTVALNDNVPTIKLRNVLDKSITIDKSTRVDFASYIEYNKGEYEFDPTYILSDESVAKMEGTTLIPLQNGIVYLTISGNFFGTKAISKTVEIVIKDNVVIFMKNEKGLEINDVYLYSVKEYNGESFADEFTPASFGVIINGEELVSPSLTVTLNNEDNVVVFDPATYKVSSTLTPGSAQYQVSYNDGTNVYVKTFDIYNNKSVFTYKGDTLETDVFGCALPVEEIFRDFTSKEVVKITSLDGKEVYEAEDGVVKGLPFITDEAGKVAAADYIVYNASVGFKVSIKTYSKIVKTAADLDFFNFDDFTKTFSGYYVLANDIDGSGYAVKAHLRTMGKGYGEYAGIGFVGTFDGRGHTISNISVGEGGLFGNIGNGGTIKNLGLINITPRVEPNKDDVAILSAYVNGSIFENVYIDIPYISAGYNAGLVATNVMSNCLFNSCYFRTQITDKSKIKSPNYGVFGSMCGQRTSISSGGFANTFKNTVVNSNIPLVCSATNTSVDGQKIKFIVDVANNPFISGEYSDYTFYDYNSPGLIRFYNDTEMSNAQASAFREFDSQFWSMTSGLKWGN